MRLQIRARNRLEENSLLDGTLLWWGIVLPDGLLSLVRRGFGVYTSEQGGGRCEVMEEYASGFAGYLGGYFID
jgi:hypothetical protein